MWGSSGVHSWSVVISSLYKWFVTKPFSNDVCRRHNLSHLNLNSLIMESNAELTAYATWFKLNKLSLNIKKSNFMIFCGQKSYSRVFTKILIESLEMPSTTFFVLLLRKTWTKHIDWKINKSNGIIRRVRHRVLLFLITIWFFLIFQVVIYSLGQYFSSQQKMFVLCHFVRMATQSQSHISTAPADSYHLWHHMHILYLFDFNNI